MQLLAQHCVPELKAGDLPLSGGLNSSPLFSNMARRFLTWLILAVCTPSAWSCLLFDFERGDRLAKGLV